jgi:hypothetical protein
VHAGSKLFLPDQAGARLPACVEQIRSLENRGVKPGVKEVAKNEESDDGGVRKRELPFQHELP